MDRNAKKSTLYDTKQWVKAMLSELKDLFWIALIYGSILGGLGYLSYRFIIWLLNGIKSGFAG